MGTLREELKQFEHRTNICSVGKLLESLEPAVRKELTEIIDDHNVSAASIERLATAKGWRIKRETFSNHRMKACRCVAQR